MDRNFVWISLRDFSRETVTRQWDFASLKYLHGSYCSKAKGTERDSQETELCSLFVDDLKQYQESHKTLKDVNEIIVQASHDTGACYGVSKCTEIVFEHDKMTKGRGLQVLKKK